MDHNLINHHRNFLKDNLRLQINFAETDQNKRIPPPPIQKAYNSDQAIITLPEKEEWVDIKKVDLISAIENRRSVRKFKNEPLTLDEISFLLWATQGIRKHVNTASAFRYVPSAGCRHSFETYLCIMNIKTITPGVYRYLPIEHALVFEHKVDDLSDELNMATLHQRFISSAAVVFVWATIPYRMEWRYSLSAHRVILIDIGHVCQNLYLACEAIGAGSCAIAAYDQDKMDALLKLDGHEEFTLYLAPVGKVS